MNSPDQGTNPSFPPVDTGRGFRASRTTRPHIFRGEAQASGRLWGFRGEYEDHRYLIQGQNSLHFTCMRSEEHTSELQSLMRISYAVFCLKKNTNTNNQHYDTAQQHKNQIRIKTNKHTRRRKATNTALNKTTKRKKYH